MERLRFVSSGTEATMSALRMARGFTGRNKIIKIDGGYHGHADLLLAAAGSGAATLGIPGSAGVTAAVVADTIIIPFHDIPAFEAALQAHEGEIAALIIEPIPGNMGLVPPQLGYLQALRTRCDQAKVLLIFDEVISGFRVARGGAQERFGVRADITCLGKIIGAGLPLGAYGGRKEIMQMIAPEGPVYQAGTLSGNPLAMAAGQAMVEKLDSALYGHLEVLGKRLESGLVKAISDTKATACVQRIGSAFTLFFCTGPVLDFFGAKLANTNHYGTFFHEMLRRGFYLPPAQLETAFISAAHGNDEIDSFVTAAHAALAATADLR
jgi:glutamate-1-semialdehyde 2,1-aminomutase